MWLLDIPISYTHTCVYCNEVYVIHTIHDSHNQVKIHIHTSLLKFISKSRHWGCNDIRLFTQQFLWPKNSQ